ncbi:hypothetical protein STAS_03877, partial [Striga asiatica]
MAENSPISSDETPYPANCPIPFDLFVSKKYEGLGPLGNLRFTDSVGNLVYSVQKLTRKSAGNDDGHCVKLLLDSSGNTLFSINRVSLCVFVFMIMDEYVSRLNMLIFPRASLGNFPGVLSEYELQFDKKQLHNKRSWQAFKGNCKDKDLIFRVNKTVDKYTRTEFKILIAGEYNNDSKTELHMKGSPFKRACTIYKDDSIVAELNVALSIDPTIQPPKRHPPPVRVAKATLFPYLTSTVSVRELGNIMILLRGGVSVRAVWIIDFLLPQNLRGSTTLFIAAGSEIDF